MKLQYYLDKYLSFQKDILLVSRTSPKKSWADRCNYQSSEYDKNKHYNHRSILANEVVVEFDNPSVPLNKRLAERVGERLKKDGIKYMLWSSGNKSYHLHFLINTKQVRNLRLLKKVVMNHYTQGFPVKPDKQMAVDNHPIRCEFGLHEKSGKYKTLVYKARDYFVLNNLPQVVWQSYSKAVTTVVRRKVSTDLGQLDKCSCLKYIGTADEFRENQDGCERALFVLIHTLKHKYSRDALTDYLWSWYKYAGGYKLGEVEVRSKVGYHYKRTYGTFHMVQDLLEDLGKDKILKECEVHGKRD